IDAIDYVDMFLDDEGQTDPDDLNDLYVLVNFRPVVTKKNWRMDCGVAGYDNTFGLPPSFPPVCASRITSIACGFSRTALRPRMSMPRRTIQRATTCAILRLLRSLMRRFPTSSSGKSSPL